MSEQAEGSGALCRCTRPVVYLQTFGGTATELGQLLPYCSACEYQPCATCDCVPPERRPAQAEGGSSDA